MDPKQLEMAAGYARAQGLEAEKGLPANMGLTSPEKALEKRTATDVANMNKINTIARLPVEQQAQAASTLRLQMDPATTPLPMRELMGSFTASASEWIALDEAVRKGDNTTKQQILARLKPTPQFAPHQWSMEDTRAAMATWRDLKPAELKILQGGGTLDRPSTFDEIPPDLTAKALTLAPQAGLTTEETIQALLYPEKHPKELEKLQATEIFKQQVAGFKSQLDELEAAKAALVAAGGQEDQLTANARQIEQVTIDYFYECYGRMPVEPEKHNFLNKFFRAITFNPRPTPTKPTALKGSTGAQPGASIRPPIPGASPTTPEAKKKPSYEDAYKR